MIKSEHGAEVQNMTFYLCLFQYVCVLTTKDKSTFRVSSSYFKQVLGQFNLNRFKTMMMFFFQGGFKNDQISSYYII